MIIEKNGDVSPKEIADIRESVGWGRNEEAYPEVLKRHSAYFTSRNSAGKLIGYVSVLSDEVADAFVLDLMVDPECQREGIGLSLVESVLDYVESLGIQCLQCDLSRPSGRILKEVRFSYFQSRNIRL